MTFEELRPYLTNLKKRGGQYIALCPVCHDDHHLYVKPEGDHVLLYCQKCNADNKDIWRALNIPKQEEAERIIVEQYDHKYNRSDGTLWYCKTRTKYSDGSKKFTFWHCDQDGIKRYTKPKDCTSLYNLDLLAKADRATPLYIVEGEKCADIMVKHGFLATTTNTGAGGKLKISKTDIEFLNEFPAKIVIPDHDDAGLKYAENFYDSKVLLLSDIWPEIKPKQDIYDFITLNQNLDLIRKYQFKIETPFAELTKEDLISPELFERLLRLKDNFEHMQAVTACTNRARDLKCVKDFENNFKHYKISLGKKRQNSSRNKTDFVDQPLQLNCGEWIADGFGVKKNEMTNQGEWMAKWASPIPVLPTQILYNADSGMEKLRLDFFKEGWRHVLCERSITASSHKIIELANKGLEVNSENSKLLVKYIADCVSMNLDILPRYNAVSRMGWIEDDFMPYSTEIKFDGEKENKFLFESVTQKGSYENWIAFIKPLRQNRYFRLMMAASFASPLIEKVNALPFVFHLWGGTGSGKTVGLMAAMSIWGNPKMGKMVRTMNMTANSMLSTAAFLCNLPFAGDELQTIKSRWENYDNLIMKITEGIDRGRMTYNRNDELKTWKCSFLFTGEEPCTRSASGGGVKNRVIELECVHEVVANGNKIVTFINDNYGYAGIQFIQAIAKKNFTKEYDQIFKDILDKTETTEKQAMAMALILLADKIATEVIFKEETPLVIEDIRPYLSNTAEVDNSERAYEFVMGMISIHTNRFHLTQNSGEFWGEFKDGCVYINKNILVREMKAEGFEFDAVKSKWAEKGYLERNSQGKLFHQTKCAGIKASYIKLKEIDTAD